MSAPSPQWLAEALFASTVLMLLVLAVRRPAQRAFGARIAYLLWLLPALRMALPAIGWPTPAPLHLRMDLPAGASPVVEMGLLVAPAPVPASAVWPTDVVTLLIALWAAGAAAHLAWHLLAHRRFLRRIVRGATLLSREAGIAVHAGAAVPGPLATGLWRRMILLPADFAVRYAPRERRLVLAHEVAHHCRGDLFANHAALVILSLHWFNPLAHIAYRAFRIDQELACDETVLAAEPGDARADYGRAIVKSAAADFPAAACAMQGAGLIKRRLRMMARKRPGLARMLAGAALGVGLVGGGLLLTASARPVPPQPPAAPVPPVAPAPVVPPAPAAPAAAPVPAATAVAPVRAPAPPDAGTGFDMAPDAAEERRIAAEAERAGLAAARAGAAAARAGAVAAARAEAALARVDVDRAVRGALAGCAVARDRDHVATACPDEAVIRVRVESALVAGRRAQRAAMVALQQRMAALERELAATAGERED